MNEAEVRSSLASVLVSDRSLSVEAAGELAAQYLAWRAGLPTRKVQPWEDRKAQRYIEGAWLWEGRPVVAISG